MTDNLLSFDLISNSRYLKITGTLEKLKATIAEVELVDIRSFIGFTKERVTSMDL